MKFTFKLFAFAVCMTAFNSISKAQTPDIDPNAPILKFAADTVKYGTIANGADGWRTIKITNTGKSPLTIDTLETECGCTTVKKDGKRTWPKEPIAPGKSSVIQVHYDTKRVGKFTKHVTVRSNGKEKKQVFVITGEVLPEGVQPPRTKPPVKTKTKPVYKPNAGKVQMKE